MYKELIYSKAHGLNLVTLSQHCGNSQSIVSALLPLLSFEKKQERCIIYIEEIPTVMFMVNYFV